MCRASGNSIEMLAAEKKAVVPPTTVISDGGAAKAYDGLGFDLWWD